MQTNFFLKKPGSIITVILITLLNFPSQAQTFDINKIIDSLKTALPALKDTARINCLNSLGTAYLMRNPDSARLYAMTALKESKNRGFLKGIGLADFNLMRIHGISNSDKEAYTLEAITVFEKLNSQYLLGYGYNFLAYLYKDLGKDQLAIEYFKKGILINEKTAKSPKEIVIMYDDLSYYYKQLGNYKESFEYKRKSFDLNKKINDPFGILWSLQSFGELFDEAGDKESATEYYQKAIRYFHSTTFKESPPYRIIANTFLLLSNNDSALSYFDKALSEAESKDFNATIKANLKRYIQMERAKVFLNSYQYDKAIECVSEALKFYAENRDKKDIGISSMLTMANAQIGLKNYPAALEYATEAYKLSKDLHLKKDNKAAGRLLWKIHDQLSNTDSAYYYLRQYLAVKESLEENRSFNELAFFKASQKNEEREARLQLLTKENKIKEQNLVIQRQNLRRESVVKKFLIAGLLGLFVLGLILVRSVLLKRRLESEKRILVEKDLQLQKIENERRITEMEMMALRSQMNPHFIFNCLNSINRFVLRNDTEAASGYLTKFSKLMRMVLENSKQTLIPLEEEVKCLELYIQMEQFRCKNSFTYYIKYHDGVNTEEAMIPPLLLQPFVENAIWHGVNPKDSDGEIGIEFLQKEEALYCIVKDNGIGRKKASELKSQLAANHKSMGLQITKERLAVMGINHSNEQPVEIEDLYDENGLAAGTQVTIKVFSLPAFEELKPSLNL
jgi:tetratricopeptide (TPR) repeat protein